MSRPRVLVCCPTPLAEERTGPALRALALARELARRFPVTLAIPGPSAARFPRPGSLPAPPGADEAASPGGAHGTRSPRGVPTSAAGADPARWPRDTAGLAVVRCPRAGFPRLAAKHDVVVTQGLEQPARTWAGRAGPIRVFDLYDPVLLEQGSAGRNGTLEAGHVPGLTAWLLRRADFVLCASERQRDLWAGAMYVGGRLTAGDVEARIGIVPYGHDGGGTPEEGPVLRGRHPAVGRDAQLVIWGGGVWDWLDPLTPIQAMPRILRARPGVRLVFPGAHPAHAAPAAGRALPAARELAQRLGVLGSAVLFLDRWLSPDGSDALLAEADLALCAAPEGAENAYSFRSRLVHALGAGLPVICTRGGGVAAFVERHGAGVTVPGGDADALARALASALEPAVHARLRRSVAGCRDELRWERCVTPLVRFCERVAAGEYARPSERSWSPWLGYLRYKVPALVARRRHLRGRP